jgi:hypothetical protein
MEQRRKVEMIRALDARLDTRSFDGRVVFLFGHCNATEEMADYLLARGVAPAAIFDNSQSKRGLLYREIAILPPEQIQGYTAENSIVLIASRFFAEMCAQLRRLGYAGEVVQVVEYDSFAEFSLSDETLERRTARIYRGMKTLERLRARFPLRHLVVCPNDALGDVYWAMSFLPAYRKKRSIDEVAIVVIGDACRQVAEMFGAVDVAPLGHAEMDELVQAIIFVREGNAIIAHHDRPYTDNIIKWLDKHFLSFIDYYRCAVYGLPKDTPPALPTGRSPFDDYAEIPKGRSVILSSHAKSVLELPEDFWVNIAEDYARQGYAVFTNVTGDDEPIRGTQALRAPVSQMIAAAEYAGTFIGIRSGLCDVVHTANCRKIVVFPDCFYSTTPHKVEDFFALPGWEKIVAAPREDCGVATRLRNPPGKPEQPVLLPIQK